MEMSEALEWAADYTVRNKLFDPVVNQRGYSDGWKPPTPAEKMKIIKELAETVVTKPIATVPDEYKNMLRNSFHQLDAALTDARLLEVARDVREDLHEFLRKENLV